MAVPKRKVSNARRDSRRAHWKLALPGMVKCPNCQEFKLPHRVCGNCGFYKGKEIVKKEVEGLKYGLFDRKIKCKLSLGY